MEDILRNKKVAILVTNGFEEVELTEPKRALERAGAVAHIVSPEKSKVKAWDKKEWGKEYNVDQPLNNADPTDYDALLLPGGVINPDHLRMNAKAVSFVNRFIEDGKPIAAICHGPWTLIETGALKGRRVTSYASIKTDLINAGADWVDEEVVVDRGLVTSRNPGDIPAFCKMMIEEFSEGVHEEQKTL
ncbi:ThiJ/PfpI family protein [Fulvivirga imtechensis AK7]|uniref:ThiJ/PfpI family protein n=1 Tax=Fulvivirga imtechensis AK7 TaxID=1237149 RepID=L8JWP3_9BACT|nr:type 1 glutamine amidotransferase domain-containing protein [Fulvivirga imtechensis]ELR73195.1 ThiJ/PfpI family protein [Fulvivirga imtechensis AK7]